MLCLACLVAVAFSESVQIPVEITAEIATSSGNVEKFQQIINFRVDPQSQITDPAKTPEIIGDKSKDKLDDVAVARCVNQSDSNGDGSIDKEEMHQFVECLTLATSAIKKSTDHKLPQVQHAEYNTGTTTITITQEADLQEMQPTVNMVLDDKANNKKIKKKVQKDNARENGRHLCTHAFCKDSEDLKLKCEEMPFFKSCMLGVAGGYSIGNHTANMTQIHCGIVADHGHVGYIPIEAIHEWISCIHIINIITENTPGSSSAEHNEQSASPTTTSPTAASPAADKFKSKKKDYAKKIKEGEKTIELLVGVEQQRNSETTTVRRREGN